jgi:peroxiredoxin
MKNSTWCRAHWLAVIVACLGSLETQSVEGSSIMGPEARVSAKKAGAKALQGSTPPEWQAERWLNSTPLHLSDLRGKVVLVRWWTANCRYCSTTAPALRGLHEKYGLQDLVVIGMYHHKGNDPFDPKAYKETVREYGFKFPVAFDPEWRTFHSWMRDPQGKPVDTGLTSVTFVLDKKGVVRHVHPGGSFVKGDEDYQALTAVIERLFDEGS